MLSLLQQAVKEDIMVLLQHNGSSYSIWKALRSKFVGSQEMIKNKKSLLKKEFDLFRGLKNESTKQIIERYCNLLVNMRRVSINKDNEELIEKLADALPHETWGTYLMMLINKKGFNTLTLSKFIEKLEAQEMEQRKIVRMKDFDGEQDIGLYYKTGLNEKTTSFSPKVETGFNAKNSSGSSSTGSSSKTSFSSFPTFDPNISATKNGRKLQCNIVLNLENDQDYSEEVAKNHMSLLGMVLESYSSFVAGKIGNPMLTKEDYDQIDAEEMELMDIKWCVGELRNSSRSQEEMIYDKYISADGKALIIDQDDEKLPEGFNWENFTWDDYIPDQTPVHTAFVARIEEDSDDDGTEYYAKQMRDHLKMMAESDSEDDKAKKKKKKVKTPVSSDDETVPVVRRKVKEVSTFKIDEEAVAKKCPVMCENCEAMKKQNSSLIHNMNRLKESYDVLNKAMNMYNDTSEE
ncbi:hypothetical protein HanPI659440_Chr10g0365821 [Helianthus annuus]|nr:hypothetical protein HanPI659440_Chr10g0365821 [Helianthus annuus]